MKVTVLGAAGGIGQPLSLLLKTQLPAGTELALYDVVPATPGVAVDVSHIPSPVYTEGYTGKDLALALKDANIVAIVAGMARKPGMTRQDLLLTNANIMIDLVKAVAMHCPTAFIAIVTNPVNTLVPLAARVLKAANCYDKRKLFGVTLLDVLRTQSFAGECKQEDPTHLQQVPVIGGHSAETILPLLSQLPGPALDQRCVEEITQKVRAGGTLVVDAKAGTGSATLSMAAACCRFVLTLLRGLEGEPYASICAYVDNANAPAPFFGQPVRIGREGIEGYVNYAPLNDFEKQALEKLLPVLLKDIATADTIAI